MKKWSDKKQTKTTAEMRSHLEGLGIAVEDAYLDSRSLVVITGETVEQMSRRIYRYGWCAEVYIGDDSRLDVLPIWMAHKIAMAGG